MRKGFCRSGQKPRARKRLLTLTQLYNERPRWIDLLHKQLDRALFAAYGLGETLADDALLAPLLKLNHARVPDDAPALPAATMEDEGEQEEDDPND